jgi:transposase InsO family protein
MWGINEVLRFNEKLYRILSIRPGEIVWICLDDKTAKPEFILELKLLSYFDEGKLSRSADPYASIRLEEPPTHSVAFKKRENGLRIVHQIIIDENCFDPHIRAQRIQETAKTGIASLATIYSHLRRYWQRGQIPNAFLPDYKFCGSPGKTRASSGHKKLGRKKLYGEGKGIKINSDIERLFRITIEKYILSQDALKTTVGYRRFIDLFANYYPKVKPADRPTLRQFRFFYDREYKNVQRIVARTDSDVYKKDIRPLTSTATASTLGPGSRYEIDATIADIYLVDHNDRSKIIGRPTVYLVIDVFSRMIAGFYVGFDNASYAVAMQAFANACIDKTEICQQFDINISPDDWPCIGLPDILLADRGEMMSHQVDALISSLNVRIENAPPRRGDAKGIVERNFHTLQTEFKPFAPGVVTGNRVKKNGEKDYRLEAALSITEFTQILLRTILLRNNSHVMEKYDREPDLPPDIPSIPRYIWEWGIQHRSGGLRKVNREQLMIALLPRRKVTISPLGISMWSLYYTCKEILQEGWLHRSSEIQRPQALEAAYNPNSTEKIYLFPQNGSRVHWECSLTDRSRQYRGLTFWQTWEVQAQEKNAKANYKLNEEAEQRNLDSFIDDKMKYAQKQASQKAVESNRERIQQIKLNKISARNSERGKLAKSKEQQERGTSISGGAQITQDDEDYKFPRYVPELFTDPSGI